MTLPSTISEFTQQVITSCSANNTVARIIPIIQWLTNTRLWWTSLILFVKSFKVKVQLVPYLIQALGLELNTSLGCQPTGDIVRNQAVYCHYFLPDPWLPSQLQNITTLWPVSNHTACVWTTFPESLHENRMAGSWNCNLSVTSQTPQPFHCHVTEVEIMHLYVPCSNCCSPQYLFTVTQQCINTNY